MGLAGFNLRRRLADLAAQAKPADPPAEKPAEEAAAQAAQELGPVVAEPPAQRRRGRPPKSG